MSGKVMIVTGASSGIGFEVAKYLCEGGNDVILACRNEEKTNRAIEKIRRTNPNAMATFMQLDLADLESVRGFVQKFKETEKKLHVLVNNAGMSASAKDTKRQYCEGSNFELTMGTNHLGPFLLTNLLLDELKKQEDARIVNVTSAAHDPDTMKRKPKSMRDMNALDLEDLFLFKDGAYNGIQAYKNSKTANIMFTIELAKKLDGSSVKVNAVCPGFIPATELSRSSSKAQKFFHRYILGGALRFTKMTRTPQQGAQAVCTLITDDKLEATGKYFRDGAETEPSEEARDEEKQTKLWELSAGYVGLEGYEKVEVERPPEPEPPKEEKKEEKKEEEAAKEGEEEKKDEEKKDEEKKDEEKKDEEKAEDKKEEVAEEKKEEEKKEEEKKEEVPVEEAVKEGEKEPEDKPEITEGKKEEEKKEEVKAE